MDATYYILKLNNKMDSNHIVRESPNKKSLQSAITDFNARLQMIRKQKVKENRMKIGSSLGIILM